MENDPAVDFLYSVGPRLLKRLGISREDARADVLQDVALKFVKRQQSAQGGPYKGLLVTMIRQAGYEYLRAVRRQRQAERVQTSEPGGEHLEEREQTGREMLKALVGVLALSLVNWKPGKASDAAAAYYSSGVSYAELAERQLLEEGKKQPLLEDIHKREKKLRGLVHEFWRVTRQDLEREDVANLAYLTAMTGTYDDYFLELWTAGRYGDWFREGDFPSLSPFQLKVGSGSKD